MTDGGTAQKTFSYEEAARLLPRVRRLTEEAYRRVEAVAGAVASPDRPSAHAQAEVDRVVSGWAQAVMEMGLEVKGLWLVDFDNGSGYYCWRYPEEGLLYYHSYAEGFRGRMRIQ